MSKIRMGLIGCGGMGHRHLFGLAELNRLGLCSFEPVAVCDPREDNATSLAAQVETHFGKRPVVTRSLDELASLDLQSVDICSDPRHHHTLAIEAMERGWDVMTEKPMGLTVRACRLMVNAAKRTGRMLAVAENYRRDPINRLAKALIDAGVIGKPRFMVHSSAGGGNRMMISVWRHQKNASGILLDVGVHYSDILEYFLGPVTSIYAQTRLHEKTRYNPLSGKDPESVPRDSPAGVYERSQTLMPAEFEATAEDAAYATLMFENGAVCHYLEDHAAHGRGYWHRAIYGSGGSLDLPGDRSGDTITLTLADGTLHDGASILDLVPSFHLDEATTALFGGPRLWRYAFPFPETDRKIIAIEYADFGHAIEKGLAPEVTAEVGTRSVAVSYGILESGVANRTVTVDEVLSDSTSAYQAEINESLGL